MSFIIVLPLLGLLGLGVVFAVTYKKGLKAALIATGIAFVVFFILFVSLLLSVSAR